MERCLIGISHLSGITAFYCQYLVVYSLLFHIFCMLVLLVSERRGKFILCYFAASANGLNAPIRDFQNGFLKKRCLVIYYLYEILFLFKDANVKG